MSVPHWHHIHRHHHWRSHGLRGGAGLAAGELQELVEEGVARVPGFPGVPGDPLSVPGVPTGVPTSVPGLPGILRVSLEAVGVGVEAGEVGAQRVQHGEGVRLVAHEGLVEPREGGEAGGEVVHLAPARQHLRPRPGAPLQQGGPLTLALCNRPVKAEPLWTLSPLEDHPFVQFP